MRIGIDCDGVLRDLITCITDTVKETHPQHADKILEPTSRDWDQWLPFWTNDETEKYVFEDNYLDFFGVECPPIKEAVEDWTTLRAWAIKHGHQLCLVSAQENIVLNQLKRGYRDGGLLDSMKYILQNKNGLLMLMY